MVNVLEKYNLPTYASFDQQMAFEVLQRDKKKVRHEMNYVLLDKIGKGVVKQIPMPELKEMILSL